MLERSRLVVSDAVWEKVAPLLPGKVSDPGATARDNRLFLEAVLWRGGGRGPRAGLAGGVCPLGSGFPPVPPPGEGGGVPGGLSRPLLARGRQIAPVRRPPPT